MSRRRRYEVRPDGDRFVVWDRTRDAAACGGWRFGRREYAADAADSLNKDPED